MLSHKSNQFEIIATINHGTVTEGWLKEMIDSGATILRLNGAFLDPETCDEVIRRLRLWAKDAAKILVDLPGYKLRLANLSGEISVRGGMPFELEKTVFNYPEFFDIVDEGQILRANDGLDRFVIQAKKQDSLVCVSTKDCVLRRGKGIHLDGQSYRPSKTPLSELDHRLIEAARRCKVDYLGLSFVYNVHDIETVEKLIEGTEIQCLPKIESKESLNSLYDILQHSKLVIVDRGDLAAEIGIKNIWRAQRTVISMARLVNTRLIMATQFLSHMIDKPLPSIAEVDSMYDLINAGISGIQLSDETSVGQFSVSAVSFIREMASKVNEDALGEICGTKAAC